MGTVNTLFLKGFERDTPLSASLDLSDFEELYRTHGGRMKSVAYNLLGNASDAEDAVQEAFLRVYRSLGRFRGDAAVSTWIYRILVNACHDVGRQRRRRAGESPESPHEPHPPAPASDPPLRLTLERGVARLEERRREVFLLHEVYGFKHREIAEIVGVAEDVGGSAFLKTSFGAVQAARIAGSLTVASANGAVRAVEVGGPAEVTTSFGGVVLESLGGRVLVRNQNGSVEVSGVGARGGPGCKAIDLATSFAPLQVTLAPGASYDLSARTSFGRVRSDLPVTASGDLGADRLSGTLGGGGCPLVLANGNGDIRILKGAAP